jgi:hypothetical protein
VPVETFERCRRCGGTISGPPLDAEERSLVHPDSLPLCTRCFSMIVSGYGGGGARRKLITSDPPMLSPRVD